MTSAQLHSPPSSQSALRGWSWFTSKPVYHRHWTPTNLPTAWGWSHQQQWWVGLQGGGPTPNGVVRQQQLGSQHQEDQRAHCGLQKVKWWHTYPHPHQRNGGWACHQLQVSGCPHLQGPLLDPQHLHPDQEGSPVSLVPEETKEGPSVSSDSGELLLLHHQEHPYQLCHSLAWQLLCLTGTDNFTLHLYPAFSTANYTYTVQTESLLSAANNIYILYIPRPTYILYILYILYYLHYLYCIYFALHCLFVLLVRCLCICTVNNDSTVESNECVCMLMYTMSVCVFMYIMSVCVNVYNDCV